MINNREEEKMSFDMGRKIKELRRNAGITQEKTAEALGVTTQAVSRWESGSGCPDIMTIPALANFFGVTIDELFGYEDDCVQRVDALAEQIEKMKEENNGIDVNMDACILKAREAVMEYPGNGRLKVCLASVLMRAGYVRRGEYHRLDAEGYSVYDAALHSTYPEWREAMALFEKALPQLDEGKEKSKATEELMQLYLNMGMLEKASALAERAPDIFACRTLMRVQAVDGKKQAAVLGEALLEMARVCALLMVQSVITHGQNLSLKEKIQCIANAKAMLDGVCTDGNYGDESTFVAKLQLLLSVYLWKDGKQKEAFDALGAALTLAKQYDKIQENAYYTAPLIRQVRIGKHCDTGICTSLTAELPAEWPGWMVPEMKEVEKEMKTDVRWKQWVMKCK